MKIKVYRTVNLPVLYGCETWSCHIEGRMLARSVQVYGAEENIFGPKI
jgi:hypothetical protein